MEHVINGKIQWEKLTNNGEPIVWMHNLRNTFWNDKTPLSLYDLIQNEDHRYLDSENQFSESKIMQLAKSRTKPSTSVDLE